MYLEVASRMMNIFKVWLFLFCFAFLRYEFAVFRKESRIAHLETMVNSKLALGLIPIIQSRKIPVKPVLYNPLSIIYALDPAHDTASLEGCGFNSPAITDGI
ncbi:MAG: hypothetical protein KA508_00485 [Gammaproteobacteria bacterium]|nr:hypothetical protein [Gammaproteobacteria bacterium]